MKVTITILIMSFCVLTGQAQQNQKRQVAGRIYDIDSRLPLDDVTIRAKSGNSIAKSGSNGRFSIFFSTANDSLVISSVGHSSQTVSVSYFIKSEILYLKSIENKLDEVMVNTGYQTLRPNEVTGAVEVVSNAMLNMQTGTNILQRLSNIIPAFRYDNNPVINTDLNKLNVSIRGLSTINGNLDPLIVLDGFIYEGDIANIDPNSIEQISVLKDASASAIWGARAGNGVIVMNSKKGRFVTGQRTKISFSSTLIMPEQTDLYDVYQLSNKDYIDVEKMLYTNGYYKNTLNITPYLAVTPVIDLLDKRTKGLITPSDSARLMETFINQDGRKEYMQRFFSRPVTSQYALNITGGGTANTYGFGLGYTHDRTELDASTRKLNVQFSNSYRPIDRLQIDISALFADQRTRSGKATYSSLTYNGKSAPYTRFVDESGEELPFEKEFRKLYLDQNYQTGYLDWGYYPLSDQDHSSTAAHLRELFSNFNIRYRILPFLDFNIGAQYQNQRVEQTGIDLVDSYAARKYINQYSEVDQTAGTVKYNVPLGGIKNTNERSSTSYTVRSQLNADKSFGHHRLLGILGAEIRDNNSDNSSFTAYGYQEDPLATSPVDFVSRFRIKPTNANRTISGSPSFSKNVNRFISIYSNASYIWHERYGLSGSFRKDGANIFGATTNDKWSPLWSTGAFWEIGKERFFKADLIDRLKIRMTYGYSGNVDLRKTQDPIGYVATDSYTNLPIVVISELNDPSLRWEKIGTTNLGFDISVLKGRLSGSIDLYIKKGKDLYGLTDYDYTAWGLQGSITKNVASMKGRGMDLSLHSLNLQGKLKWSTGYLISLNKNKTTAYYSSVGTNILNFLGDGSTIQPLVGYPLNGIAAFKWMGLNADGRAQGLLKGEVSTDYLAIRRDISENPDGNQSIVFVGSAEPQAFGNLINTFGWRTFELSVNLSFKADYYFLKPTTSYYTLFQRGTAYPDFEQRWQRPGDEARTNVPVMKYPIVSNSDSFYQNAEINVLKGDHVRLEYISGSWKRELTVGHRNGTLQLYGNVSNIGIIWRANKQKIDPEFPYRLTPPATLSLGVKLDY